MDGKWRFSLQSLFGIVVVVAVALGLTRYLLSLLPSPELYPPWTVCFLFLESAVTVTCWSIVIGGLIGNDVRRENFAAAIFASILLLVSFAMFLPA